MKTTTMIKIYDKDRAELLKDKIPATFATTTKPSITDLPQVRFEERETHWVTIPDAYIEYLQVYNWIKDEFNNYYLILNTESRLTRLNRQVISAKLRIASE